MFDAAHYERDVLRPLRGTHGNLPQTDLPARYAIDPGMNAAELTERLTEVRLWWQDRSTAPDSAAAVCKLLIEADRQLAATTGEAMNDPAWWREQIPGWAAAGRKPDLAAAPTPAAEPPADGAEGTWRADARTSLWVALATLERPSTIEAEQAPEAVDGPDTEPLPSAPRYIDGLSVAPVGADGETCRVLASWPDRQATDVRVHWAADPPSFSAGDELPLSRATAWGTRLTGDAQAADGGRRGQSGTVPTGYLIYIPFLVQGDRAVTGRPVTSRLAGPVDRLRIERRGDGAMLFWVWPPGSSTAQVEWRSGDRTTFREVTLAEYTAENGCPVSPAGEGGEARVRAVCAVGTDLALSPPRSASLPRSPVHLRYELRPPAGLFGRRSRRILTVTADRPCADLTLRLIASGESALPMSPADGSTVQEFRGLRLHPGQPLQFEIALPGAMPRPYWIRCFADAAYPCTVEVPPVDQMRIT